MYTIFPERDMTRDIHSVKNLNLTSANSLLRWIRTYQVWVPRKAQLGRFCLFLSRLYCLCGTPNEATSVSSASIVPSQLVIWWVSFQTTNHDDRKSTNLNTGMNQTPCGMEQAPYIRCCFLNCPILICTFAMTEFRLDKIGFTVFGKYFPSGSVLRLYFF